MSENTYKQKFSNLQYVQLQLTEYYVDYKAHIISSIISTCLVYEMCGVVTTHSSIHVQAGVYDTNYKIEVVCLQTELI